MNSLSRKYAMTSKISAILACTILTTAAGYFTGCCSDAGHPDMDKLNARAAQEYLDPIRPGYEGRNPYWNGFATKFIYAPAFDFKTIDGAAGYRYTAEFLGTEMTESPRYRADQKSEDPEPRWILGEGAPTGESWTFTADSPNAALSPVWNDIHVGKVRLTVEGIGPDGDVTGIAGTKEFLRDFPFHGPYNSNVRPYLESARMAALFIHGLPAIQNWKDSTVPDMTYRHNTYACKIIGATIQLECLIARILPRHIEEAEQIARNAAQFLIDESQPEGAPLAWFPPTYYSNLISSSREENQGKAMTMEACMAGNGFLDLYDLTGDRKYLEQARRIADTYRTLQAEDGSMPIKVDYTTGQPVNECKAMLTPVMEYFSRLERQYGITDYRENLRKAEKWMEAMAMSTFDMTAQFEDMTVLDQAPYQNLTNCASAPYASWLLNKEEISDSDLENAIDLIRFSEDQFVCWDVLPDPDGIRTMSTPSVYEQYGYRMPIDHSSAVVAKAMLDLYEITGDELVLAKAKALVDNLTVVQNPLNGQIPTSLDLRGGYKNEGRGFWTNCTYASITALLKMVEIEERLHR